jgi:deoxyribodipyrimidine photolyase-related protein
VSARQRSIFADRLRNLAPGEGSGRRWIFVPYDQLTDRVGPLSEQAPGATGIVLCENAWKAARRPYHRQKLALLLANMRHFALEQAERGVAVRYLCGAAPYRDLLRPVAEELGPLTVMEPAERELRADLAPLARDGLLETVPHAGWLTSPEQFRRHRPGPPWRMDAFYRLVRRELGVLVEADGSPVGGKFSFDAENRRPWRGEPPAAVPPATEPDAITLEVCALVERRFARHPGVVDPAALPATRTQVDALWAWARAACLPQFGPFEDAMSTRSTNLFHTRISALLHLHRLLPRQIVEDVLAMDDLPLASKEGFIRQVLGWREFVRHVHRETDGFRNLPGAEVRPEPGDGGYRTWAGESWAGPDGETGLDGGAAPAALEADRALPPALWGLPSGLACLDAVVDSVWREAYGHHITRLMVIANLGTLLDLDARQLTDWFWVAYADAYDWVVEPNVLGMGTHALGELFTTKPYVSGAAYIDRMSDYCRGCAFDPKKTCPITRLYWAFLQRNFERLRGNVRLAMPLRSLERRSPAERERDRRTFEAVSTALGRGDELSPDGLAAAIRGADRR